MQSLFKRIGAFLLAILVWVATSSFTLSMHYCGTKMVSHSVLKKAKPCCVANKSLQLSGKVDFSSFKMNCCKDKKIEKDSEKELTFSIAKTTVELQKLLLRLPQLVNFEYIIESESVLSERFADNTFLTSHYYPDKNILFQVFLI